MFLKIRKNLRLFLTSFDKLQELETSYLRRTRIRCPLDHTFLGKIRYTYLSIIDIF